MPLLLDTGALYALADADDSWHKRMRDFLESQRAPLLVPVTVIPETAYLLRSRLGPLAELRFAESLAAAELAVENLTSADVRRCAELLGTYDFLGYVDASVIAVAERLKLKALVTTDRRDFGRVRPRHVRAFDLLPLQ
jgi:predicted nucleic acid-binding protein